MNRSINSDDELLLKKNGEFFVNGEHIEGEGKMPEDNVIGFPGSYKNLIQDPTDLPIPSWDAPTEKSASIADIALELAEPYFKTIEKLTVESIIVLDDKSIRIFVFIRGTLNNTDFAQDYGESFIIGNKSIINLNMLDLKYPISDLATRLKVQELQFVENHSLNPENKNERL